MHKVSKCCPHESKGKQAHWTRHGIVLSHILELLTRDEHLDGDHDLEQHLIRQLVERGQLRAEQLLERGL